ncbi:MAG: class I SAM-dependent methyltransferase [Dehalococcoidales bacterium]|nr:MAG: class I SAM-dependent methyltransferase [Dehalococcoidales bacterium]
MDREGEPLFNAGAALYDSFTFLRCPAELTAEKAYLFGGQEVLDIACGSGWATMKAARIVGENGRVTGIDIADKLLDIARQKAASYGLMNIDYREGDVHNLDFNDNSFDAVICASSLFLFSDISRALNEGYRVLKTDGTMVFSTFGKNVFQPVTGLINDWMKTHPETVFPASAISITDSPEKCREIFVEAGFESVEITEETCVIHFSDEEECWRQISASLIVRPRLSRMSPDDYKMLKKEILPELDRFGNRQGIPVVVPIIFCTVKKL